MRSEGRERSTWQLQACFVFCVVSFVTLSTSLTPLMLSNSSKTSPMSPRMITVHALSYMFQSRVPGEEARVVVRSSVMVSRPRLCTMCLFTHIIYLSAPS